MITAFCLISISIAVWLTFFFDPNSYKQDLLQKLNSNHNISAVIRGPITLHILSSSIEAHDIRINLLNNRISTNWENISAKVNIFKILSNAINQITLHNGIIKLKNNTLLPVKQLQINNIYNGNKKHQANVLIHNNNLNIAFLVKQKKQITLFEKIIVTSKYNNKKLHINIPHLKYYPDIKYLNINNIKLNLNNQNLKAKVSISSFSPLNYSAVATGEQLNLDRIVNMNGFKLQFNTFKVTAMKNSNSPVSHIKIESDSSTLNGINLNHIAYLCERVLNSLNKGSGIENAYQSLQERIMPFLNNHHLKPNAKQKTHFNNLLIDNIYDSKKITTTNINWQADSFYLSGQGQWDLLNKDASYKSYINIKGDTKFAIPYNISYQNQKLKNYVEQNELQKSLQPILKKALESIFKNKMNSIFG